MVAMVRGKVIPSSMVRRDTISERLLPDVIRQRSASPTTAHAAIGGGRESSISLLQAGLHVTKARQSQREISWVDYEQLLKARQDVRCLQVSRFTCQQQRSSSAGGGSVSRSPSQGPSQPDVETDDTEEEEIHAAAAAADDDDDDNVAAEDVQGDPNQRPHVRFSVSLPVRPSERLGFTPIGRKTGSRSLSRPSSAAPVIDHRRRSSSVSSSLWGATTPEVGAERSFNGELHKEIGQAVILTPRIPGGERWGDPSSAAAAYKEAPSITQKLEQEGLAMRVPDYLANLRGESRDTRIKCVVSSQGVPLLGNSRRSAFVRTVKALTNIDGIVCAGLRTSKYITVSPKARLSTVIVPVNAKQWLLQSMRLRDTELRDLFDQVDLVPQLAADHIRQVRAEWEALEAKELQVPAEVDTLVKDQALLATVKRLLAHFIESIIFVPPGGDPNTVDEKKDRASSSSAAAEKSDDETNIERGSCEPALSSEGTTTMMMRSTPTTGRSLSRSFSRMFQGFEHDREGGLSPVFGMGASLCRMCGQIKPRGIGRDSHYLSPTFQQGPLPDSPLFPVDNRSERQRSITQLLGLESMDQKQSYSPNDKRWFTVLFPALQPGKREDVQLLGEWLRHATQQNQCEDSNGHISDVDCAFVLNSIAFLEVVRQVRLQCEERGDMLLCVWRQLLRIFSQVIVRAEPKLIAMELDVSQLRETLSAGKQQIAMILQEVAIATKQCEVLEIVLKEKELQWSKLKRCHLCLGENLTTKLREKSLQQGGGSGTGRHEDERIGGVDQMDGSGEQLDQHQGDDGAEAAEAAGLMAITDGGAAADGEMASELMVSSGSKHAYKPGVISQGFAHADGLHVDVGVQTDPDMKGRTPFFAILQKPTSAPGRMMTVVIEEFLLASGVVHRDRQEGEEEEGAGDQSKDQLIGGGSEDNSTVDTDKGSDAQDEGEGRRMRKSSFKALAADTIDILEQLPDVDADMAEKLQGIIAMFQRLKSSTRSVGASGDDEGSDTDGDETDSSRRKGKLRGWSQLRKGIENSKQLSDKFFSIAKELMTKQKKLQAKGTKPKDLPNVPLGFSKMMKVNVIPKAVKSFNDRQLLKLVESIYSAKIIADAVDDSQENERQNMCEFMYDFMLNSYGLKGLAESAVHGVFKRIKQLMITKAIDKHHRLRLFQRFCNYDPLRGYMEAELYLYLKTLAKAESKLGVLLPAADAEDGTNFLNCAQLEFLLEEPSFVAQFRGNKDIASGFLQQVVEEHGTLEKASNEVQKITKLKEIMRLDFDVLMEMIIEINPHKEVIRRQSKAKVAPKVIPLTKEEEVELENLFIAGDANQDGVLTLNEFREIVSSADASVSETNALRMFRETVTLMPDGGDSISPTAFAIVAHAHGLKAPATVVFGLLKKTWLQIQDDVNEEKMREKHKKKEAEEMRASLREMIKEKNDVSRAVQTFRSFVLKFCGSPDHDHDQAEINVLEPPLVEQQEDQELTPLEEPLNQEEEAG
ncbi:unnamed protein product [Sphagnum troendelagicum]|uniref:EF-hand domain-containing protein n=1 Tax=Sphagnum troendelagicum TaxID=128251 RepID=A0ABP0V0F2_9BRYO